MNASKEDPVDGDQDGKQYFSITTDGKKYYNIIVFSPVGQHWSFRLWR